jgi:quercetin dioxygenase-like cupin family protein
MTTITIPDAQPFEACHDDHAYLRTHRISGDVLRFQLPFEESRLQEQASSSDGGRAGKTLVKQGSLRITQLALQKGVRLPWHEVGGAVSVQILRGRLQMVTSDGKMDLVPGALVAVDAGVQHSAVAMSDCVMLITISMHEQVCS